MRQEQGGQVALPGIAVHLRPKPALWQNVANFYRHKPLGGFGGTVAIILILVAIFAPLIATHNPRATSVEYTYAAPGKAERWLGGDQLGRDVFNRLVYGARISLEVGMVSVLFGVTIGSFIGIFGAYFGGKTDLLIQRIIDSLMAFPALILALALMAALGSSITNVIIALAIVFVPGAARTIRAQALSIKETDYVLAARAVVAGDWRIMLRHIAPNCAATYIVLATISLGWAIIVEASLSFLGLGVPPDVPTWGGMLTGAANHVSISPWLGVFPGLAITLVVFAYNLLGDSLRDVLDPRLRGAG